MRKEAGIPLEIVKRSDTVKGFHVLPKRWIVERTFGWLGRCRRLGKDFESLTRVHAAFIILAMTGSCCAGWCAPDLKACF